MAGNYLHLFESQENEVSVRNFFDDKYNGGEDENRKRMKKLLYAGLKHELTDRQKVCIRMKYVDGLSAAEIANELDLSSATVYKHIRCGMKRLKKMVYYL